MKRNKNCVIPFFMFRAYLGASITLETTAVSHATPWD